MFCYIVSSLIQSLRMHLVVDKLRFAKMILLRLMVCYLVRLKRYYLELSKNNGIFKQNWSNVHNLHSSMSEFDSIA